MDDYRFIKVSTKDDLRRFFPIMLELRPHISFTQFVQIYEKAHSADGYELLGVEADHELLAMM